MFELVNRTVKGLQTSVKSIRTSGIVFKVITKYTTCLLMLFATFSTAKMYFGDPIVCNSSSKSDSQVRDVIAETFCWSYGTYIDANLLNTSVGITSAYYGVGSPRVGFKINAKPSNNYYQRYYQWVAPILGLQALFFFLPKLLWTTMENGRMAQLCSDIKEPYISENWNTKHKKNLTFYVLDMPLSSHRSYALKYFFCELLSVLALIANIFLIHVTFAGFWSEFGPAVLAFAFKDWNSWSRFTAKLFPKMAKCDFYAYGPSGSLNKLDFLCLLPLNVINEKVFSFLYFWYILLVILCGWNIIYKFQKFGSAQWRIRNLHRLIPSIPIKVIESVTRQGNFGVCFILDVLAQNITYRQLSDLVDGTDHIESDVDKITDNNEV